MSYVPPPPPAPMVRPPIVEPSSAPQQPLGYESAQGSVAISIGSIAVKLLGVYCIVLALPVVSYAARIFQQVGTRGPGMGWIVLLYSPYLIYAGAGAVLIRAGDWIAARLFGGGSMLTPLRGPAGEYWQAMAFSIAGVMTLLHALPSAAMNLYYLAQSARNPRGDDLVLVLAEIITGLVLFLGSKGLARFWHKLRTAGTSAERL